MRVARVLAVGVLAVASAGAEAAESRPEAGGAVTVAMGLGSTWGVGGAAPAWGEALGERFELAGEVGRHRVALGFVVDHARRDLVDASVLIPDAAVPAGALTGTRDELALLFTVRVPLQVGADLPEGKPVLRVLPTFAVSAGLFASDAQLVLPSFSAAVPLRSRSLLPVLGARAGCELRAFDWMSLLPHAELLMLVAGNRGELSGREQFDVEGRILLGADVLVRF